MESTIQTLAAKAINHETAIQQANVNLQETANVMRPLLTSPKGKTQLGTIIAYQYNDFRNCPGMVITKTCDHSPINLN